MKIVHDNGNHVCFEDGSVFVRQDQEYFNAKGERELGDRALYAAILSVV